MKSLKEERARLDFSDFLSTLFSIFHVINEKFHPARLLIYLSNKKAGRVNFFSKPARLFRSARLFGTSESNEVVVDFNTDFDGEIVVDSETKKKVAE